jgi:hypothetical protein
MGTAKPATTDLLLLSILLWLEEVEVLLAAAAVADLELLPDIR